MAGGVAVAPAPISVPAGRLEEATVAQIEGIVDQAMIDDPVPGFELCIVRDGQIVYGEGFGLADLEENRPVTPQLLLMQGAEGRSSATWSRNGWSRWAWSTPPLCQGKSIPHWA